MTHPASSCPSDLSTNASLHLFLSLRRYKTNVVQLSTQALVDCFYGPVANPFYGCDGGDLPIYSIRWTSGVKAWKLPSNAAYPYTATTGSCNTALLSNSGMTVYGWVDGASASVRALCMGGMPV